MTLDLVDIVRGILRASPETRDNDYHLWFMVCYYQHHNLDSMTAHEFLKMAAEGRVPCFKSVERCRRKIQEREPHLCGSKKVMDFRADLEQREIVSHVNYSNRSGE